MNFSSASPFVSYLVVVISPPVIDFPAGRTKLICWFLDSSDDNEQVTIKNIIGYKELKCKYGIDSNFPRENLCKFPSKTSATKQMTNELNNRLFLSFP